jgi:hypothetical protein
MSSLIDLPLMPIRIYRGEYQEQLVTIWNADLVPDGVTPDPDNPNHLAYRQNLTGMTLSFKVKETLTSASYVDVFTKSTGTRITHAAQSGSTLGQATMVFEETESAAQTLGQMVHQMWITDGAGNPRPVYRPSPLYLPVPVGP